MRQTLWAALVVCFGWVATALAGESVSVSGRATAVFQYPKTNTICLAFETKDRKHFLVCDDVTAKDVIEQLFALGKKDAPCHIEGTVAKISGDDVRLRVTKVTPENR